LDFAAFVAWADLLGDDEQAIAGGAERGAGDEGEDRLVGVLDERGDVGWFDNFASGHLVSIAF